jgi:hypothetical protein
MATVAKWIKPVKGRSRTLSGPFALVYAATAVFFSAWYLYTSGFGLVSTETNRGFYFRRCRPRRRHDRACSTSPG